VLPSCSVPTAYCNESFVRCLDHQIYNCDLIKFLFVYKKKKRKKKITYSHSCVIWYNNKNMLTTQRIQFFCYSYSNNFNFNNKSDKIKILRIRIAVRHNGALQKRQWKWRFFFIFNFFLKKKLNDDGESDIFRTPVSNARNSNFKKIERCHSQRRLCINVSLGLTCLHSATGNDALPFIFLKF
jgi:hypothetical protein